VSQEVGSVLNNRDPEIYVMERDEERFQPHHLVVLLVFLVLLYVAGSVLMGVLSAR
jgi:hypothetical protein